MASFGILILQSIGLLIVLGVASELLAKGSHILEVHFGSGFTGSVILGFITMLPELIFVLITVRAAGEDIDLDIHPDGVDESYFDVALGSAVGGNILLFTLGYGMVILIAYIKHDEHIKLPVTLKDDLIYLFVASLYLLFTALKGYFAWYDGVILFGMYFVFVIHQWFEVKGLKEEGKLEEEEHEEPTQQDWLRSVGLLVIGGIGILIAAEPFVHAIVDISHEVGISPIFLALVVSPIASELPEKISAFALAARDLKGAETAVANFIGSKIQASTLLFGSMIMYKMILFDEGNFFGAKYLVGENFIQIMLAVLTTLTGVWITYDLKLHLKEGWVVLGLYIVSIVAAFIVLG